MPVEWEEQTERRLGVVEQKVDKILDPESGIYPKLTAMQSNLKNYVISILLAILTATIAIIGTLLTVKGGK